MPKLKPETQHARREHILDKAERCFARHGFHATTMQMLCKEAGISPGALYVYFDSKEALIAGICERDRAEFRDRFAAVGDAPDVMDALRTVARHYFVDEAQHKLAITVEMGAESMRNDVVGEFFRACDAAINESIVDLLERLTTEGRIKPLLPPREAANMMLIIGDGLLWRRAVDPEFNGEAMLPAVLSMIGMLIGPQEDAGFSEPSDITEAGP